jgi:hypothetical protein
MSTLLTRTLVAALALVAAVPAAPAAAAQPASGDCAAVDVQVTDYPTGPDTGVYMVILTITNLCPTQLSGWTLRLTLAPGHTVHQGWSANWTVTGDQVTATNVPWNAVLTGPGGSTTIGFIGSYTGTFQSPGGCTFNGAPCAGTPPGNQPPEVTLTGPAGGAGIVESCPVTLAAEAADPDGAVDRVEFYLNDVLVGTDQAAPYRVEVPPGAAGPLVSGDNRAYARAVDDGAPALSTDSEVVTFALRPPPPAVMVIACTPALVVEAGGVASVTYLLTAAGTTVPVDLAVTGDAGAVTVSPASFAVDSAGQQVTVTAAPGSAGATATIVASSPGVPAGSVQVTVVG